MSFYVNRRGVLLKSMNTPPTLSLMTLPVAVATNRAEFEPRL